MRWQVYHLAMLVGKVLGFCIGGSTDELYPFTKSSEIVCAKHQVHQVNFLYRDATMDSKEEFREIATLSLIYQISTHLAQLKQPYHACAEFSFFFKKQNKYVLEGPF